MNEDETLSKARRILRNLKEEVLYIITETETNEYCSNRLALPWLEEDAEYAIKKLELPPEKEKFYLKKVYRILGEYSEEVPQLIRKRKLLKDQV
ncbi:MAG: hypothetical protein U5Q03_20730 [Bacteroidota bacterium]|nr:hypothetical protein [Bacteroidota bacterium]